MGKRDSLRQQGYGRKRGAPSGPPLPNDAESLAARKAERGQLRLDEDLLKVCHQSKTKAFKRDFTHLTEQAPQIKLLALQLLAGAKRRYGTDCSYTTLQDLYMGIEEFIQSVCGPDNLGVNVEAVENINIQIAKNFDAWLLQKYPGRTLNRKRFARVRTTVQYLKKNHPDALRIGSPFTWPPGPKSTEKVSESYTSEVFNDLTRACLQDIKFVQATMRSVDAIVSSTERISYQLPTLEELIRTFADREMQWTKLGRTVGTRPSVFENTIRKSPIAKKCIERWGISMDDLVLTYRARRDECLKHERVQSRMQIDPNGLIKGYSAADSYRIAMATVMNAHPRWPLDMGYKEANDLISFEGTILRGKLVTAEETRTYKILQRMTLGNQDHSFEVGLMAYFAHLFFTTETLYPFFLYVQLNTGWNEEVILSLTDSVDAHIEPDLLDPDYVIIYGGKERVNKAQACRSNKTNPLSVYRVLKFIESVLHRYRGSTNYLAGTLWQFVLSKNLWNKYEKVTAALDSGNIGAVSASFLRRHGIVVDPEKSVQRMEARRVRTTYETRRRESGLSLEEVSPLLGHSELATTDRNYDSDKGSTELKNRRIRELQNRMIDDFKHYSARLISNQTLAALRAAIGSSDTPPPQRSSVQAVAAQLQLTEAQAIHLLSPKGQTYIVACINRTEPTWPDARLFVPAGSDCTFFNRCCLCDKALIFREALPYIARRIQDIEELRQRMPAQEWAANYDDEANAWKQILSDWKPVDDVISAKSKCGENAYVLPLSMRGL